MHTGQIWMKGRLDEDATYSLHSFTLPGHILTTQGIDRATGARAMTTKVFSIEGKAIKFNTAADIEPFLADLTDDVEEIRLSGNTIGIEAAQALALALKGKTKLQNAQLDDIFTGRLKDEIPAALEAILPVLQQCPNLHTVNLCDNAFGPTAAAPLESFFRGHAALRHLYLQNNGMGPEAGARMARALEANTAAKLETIVCGRNRLENGSSAAWASCFRRHGATLRVVKMPQNGIRPEGVARLFADGLAHCSELEVFDLQDNTFTLDGSLALAKALPGMARLRELGTSECLLRKQGAAAVVRALAQGKNTTIETLRLQYNEIDASVLADLVAAIDTALPNVKLVELNGNKFQEDDEHVDRLRALFEKRDNGAEIDELDDMEEDSDEEEEEDDDDEDDDDDDDQEETKDDAAPPTDRKLSLSLDDAIERNLAAALASTDLSK